MILARAAGALAIGLALGLPAGTASAQGPGFAPLTLTVRPIPNFAVGQTETRFGALEYRGGLQLSSDNRDFGGLSGLDFGADGRTLYAVADTGFWFAATVVEKDGRLAGIADARLAPLLDARGRPLLDKKDADAEGLRIVSRDGRETAIVSFERKAAVSRYVAAPDFASARRQPVALPKFVSGLRANQGLEAIAVAPAAGPLGGAMVAIAERSLDRNGNHRGFVLDGPRAGSFSLVRSSAFDVTDAAFLPDGDLLVLERRFDYTSGPGMRIRRIAGATIRPGVTLDGPILIEADLRYQIDNMEGLAIRTTESGEILLTLVSDDNQNRFLQRTILLEFALVPTQPPKPLLRPG